MRVERLEARGRPVPEYLIPPEVLPGYMPWISAFWYLSRDRVQAGPIPAAAIDRHSAGMGQGEAALFRSVIVALDNVYLRHIHPSDGSNDVESARDAFRGTMDAHFKGRET